MAKDILTDENGDIKILNGDLDFGYSDEQHIEHILIAHKGNYKQHPLIGVGISDYLNSPETLITRRKLEKEITLQLETDNAKEIKVNYTNEGTIKVAAAYA